MAKLSTLTQDKTRRILVYGPPKSGKTQLVGTLAAEKQLVWFDLENGWETLLKLSKQEQEGVELIRLPDSKVYPIAIETMLKIIDGSKKEVCEEHGKVGCMFCKKEGKPFITVELNSLDESYVVVIDSLTQLANSAMNHITKTQDETYKYQFDDYRVQGSLMDKFLSQVQQAKFNVVCITHETETKLEDGSMKLVPVAGTAAFSRNTAKYFDHVVYCEVKNKSHRFGSSTTYGANVMSGSRTNTHLENHDDKSLLHFFHEQAIAAPAASATVTQGAKALTNLAAKYGAKT